VDLLGEVGYARLSTRYRWLVLALWIVIPLLATRSLPSLSSVTTTNNSPFLSATDPSQRAAALATPFQGKNASSTGLIVASRSGGPLTPADDAAIGHVEHAAAGVPGVTLVRDQGTSRDGQARKALVATSISPSTKRRRRAWSTRSGTTPGGYLPRPSPRPGSAFI
jgi:uncharacterized membrane protein YdfJ with MMPL/SSD domain